MTLPARLSRRQISDSVTALGWRVIMRSVETRVRVRSLTEAAELAARVTGAAGSAADGSVTLDLRSDLVRIGVSSRDDGWVTPDDLDTVRRISAAVDDLGLTASAGAGNQPAQRIEIAIDALDIPAVRPFWREVLGYVEDGDNALADPAGLDPGFWFQQMDAPRPQRNRIHLDVAVPHDVAADRIRAALAAGGTMVNDAYAPAFWVLADAEGNEACVCTWQGREPG
jgi:4a-hydroxytetrahydrobiopterin dehydratase